MTKILSNRATFYNNNKTISTCNNHNLHKFKNKSYYKLAYKMHNNNKLKNNKRRMYNKSKSNKFKSYNKIHNLDKIKKKLLCKDKNLIPKVSTPLLFKLYLINHKK